MGRVEEGKHMILSHENEDHFYMWIGSIDIDSNALRYHVTPFFVLQQKKNH